jgi:DNA-binding SARP family transcriptional activator
VSAVPQSLAVGPRFATRLRLALLTGFHIESDGGAVDLPLSAQRVVAFLALHEHPLQRLFVAGSLWCDATEERANASLRTALWRLRRPGCTLVAATATHLALADGVVVDVREETKRARRATAGTGEPTVADVAALCDAGDLLPDWYEDWVVAPRERFRQMRLHALEALCLDLAARGRYSEASETGLAAVASEPLRESAHRALIRAHLAEGNPGEALRQYRLYRRLLHDELGLDPSEQLEELVAVLPVHAAPDARGAAG